MLQCLWWFGKKNVKKFPFSFLWFTNFLVNNLKVESRVSVLSNCLTWSSFLNLVKSEKSNQVRKKCRVNLNHKSVKTRVLTRLPDLAVLPDSTRFDCWHDLIDKKQSIQPLGEPLVESLKNTVTTLSDEIHIVIPGESQEKLLDKRLSKTFLW